MSGKTANPPNQSQAVAPEDHRIVVFGIDDDPEALAQVLASSSEFDRVSARQLVRSLPGIIARLLTRTAAATIADEVRKLGLHATAIAATDVPDLSHAARTHHLRATEASLEIADHNGEPSSWSWSAVAVISVGIVPSEGSSRHQPAPALDQGSSHKSWSDGVAIAAKNHPEALVVFTADRTVVTFASDEMNYEYLGTRLTGASSANFRQLIKDLVARSVEAWVTPSTRAFLDRGPTRHYAFRTCGEFRRYTEFQTLLSELP